MSVDPYHQVQSEIQRSLLAAEQLRASFLRIRSTAREGNEELEWARNEVRVGVRCIRTVLTAAPLSTLAQDDAFGAGNRLEGFGRKCQVRDPALVLPHLDYKMTSGPRIVETTGARMFGLDDGEVIQRRRYVGHVGSEIEVRGA